MKGGCGGEIIEAGEGEDRGGCGGKAGDGGGDGLGVGWGKGRGEGGRKGGKKVGKGREEKHTDLEWKKKRGESKQKPS